MPRSFLGSAVQIVFCFCFLLPLSVIAEPGAAWPQFRGPGGQGHAAGAPLRWSESDGVIWKQEIPGRAWSSPVIANDRIWLTTAVEKLAQGRLKEKLLEPMKDHPMYRNLTVLERVDLWALQFDMATGELLRKVKLFSVAEPQPVHNLNSYASPTPILDDNRLYCHFGRFGTACVDVDSGETLWERQFVVEHGVGPGSTPALWENVLIIPCDGMDEQYVVAVDKLTGENVWKKDRPPLRATDPDYLKAYCTPLVFEAAGRTQVVIPGAQWFISYDPATGDELWRVDHGRGFSNVPRPVFDGELLFLNTGFTKAQLWAVRPDGEGDVTDTHVEWKWTKQVPTMPSPVVVDGLVMFVSDNGVATCLDADTGEEHWKERMAGNYCASPLAADGRVYFCNQEGRTTVVAAKPQFEVLAENELDGRFMASPAVAGGDLILRTEEHLYRIGGDR